MLELDFDKFCEMYDDIVKSWPTDAQFLMFQANFVDLNVDWVACMLRDNRYIDVYKYMIDSCRRYISYGPSARFTADELLEIGRIQKEMQRKLYEHLHREILNYCIG